MVRLLYRAPNQITDKQDKKLSGVTIFYGWWGSRHICAEYEDLKVEPIDFR